MYNFAVYLSNNYFHYFKMSKFAQVAGDIFNKANLLDSTQSTFIVVDDQLNIKYFNTKEVTEGDDTYCDKPGDFLHCQNAIYSTNGCGSSKNCAYCKLRNSVKTVFNTNKAANEEIILSLEDNRKLVIQGNMTPFDFHGKQFVAILMTNKGEKQRNMMMEKVFFHDMLNLSGALNGLIDILQVEHSDELIDEIKKVANQITEELCAQRDLVFAEDGKLTVHIDNMLLEDFINYTQTLINPLLEAHELEMEWILDIEKEFIIHTDYRILHRVLLNMTKNAMEATSQHQKISFRAKSLPDSVEFSVHNPSYIPEEIQSQVFHYGQSSKGTGHGIGTYSMKLLGENYLQGEVWFTTDKEEGTTFFLKIPQRI